MIKNTTNILNHRTLTEMEVNTYTNVYFYICGYYLLTGCHSITLNKPCHYKFIVVLVFSKKRGITFKKPEIISYTKMLLQVRLC